MSIERNNLIVLVGIKGLLMTAEVKNLKHSQHDVSRLKARILSYIECGYVMVSKRTIWFLVEGKGDLRSPEEKLQKPRQLLVNTSF